MWGSVIFTLGGLAGLILAGIFDLGILIKVLSIIIIFAGLGKFMSTGWKD